VDSSAVTKPYTQDTVNTRDALRRDGQQHLLVYIDGAFFSDQHFQVIETAKAKKVYCLYLPVYNVDKASDAMVNEWCVLMDTTCIPRDDLLKIFVITQVITSLAPAISFNNAGT
jgi:hypothetical protein